VRQAIMQKSATTQLEAPRIENTNPMLIAGLRSPFADEPWKGTPELWQRFTPYLGKIPGRVGRAAYGLCFLQPNGVDYVAGVEVSGPSDLPSDFTAVNIPAGTYLVFPHREHVSKLHITCDMISEWLPTSGYEAEASWGTGLLRALFGGVQSEHWDGGHGGVSSDQGVKLPRGLGDSSRNKN
jgi:AraC family transcriptional regulator